MRYFENKTSQIVFGYDPRIEREKEIIDRLVSDKNNWEEIIGHEPSGQILINSKKKRSPK